MGFRCCRSGCRGRRGRKRTRCGRGDHGLPTTSSTFEQTPYAPGSNIYLTMTLNCEVFSHTREQNKNVHSPTPAKLLRIPFPTLPQFTNGPAEPPIVSDGAAVKAFFRATSVFCAATACWRAKKLCASLPSRSSAAECLFNINLIMTLKKSSIQSYKITK